MDSFEWNKIAGAVLFALLVVMGIREVNSIVNHEPEVAVKGWQVPGVEATETAGAEAPKEEPLAVLLAKGSADNGAKVFKKCMACHTIEKGGANKVGPALYGIIDKAKGGAAGFNYSAGIKERAAKGEKWDYESLDAFIANPKAYVAGTLMGYAGLADPAKRADMLVYLRSLSDNPAPLPAQ